MQQSGTSIKFHQRPKDKAKIATTKILGGIRENKLQAQLQKTEGELKEMTSAKEAVDSRLGDTLKELTATNARLSNTTEELQSTSQTLAKTQESPLVQIKILNRLRGSLQKLKVRLKC